MVAAILVIALAPSVAAEAADPLDGLQRWLDETVDLTGRFEQSLLSGAMGTGLTERGRLYIARPGRMRWDYEDPETKIAIIDGMDTLLYVEEDRELFRGSLDGEGNLLAVLLTAERPLAALFRITPQPDGADGSRRLALEPLHPGPDFERVVLSLRPPGYSIEAAEVLDAAGNRVLYVFQELRRNEGLEPGLFRFEPPPGTVISGAP